MMKMKGMLSVLATGATLLATAQPTLTRDGNGPGPGDTYRWRFSEYVAPGASGSGQTWDMSGLTTDSIMDVSLVEPMTTPAGASFPTATVAEVSDGSTVYFRVGSDGVHMLGYEAEGDAMVYSDEGRYLLFPCTYQTDWSDTYEGSFTSEGITIEQSGNITGEVDGYGTLILPGATYNDVLRVHWVQEQEDVFPLFTLSTVFDSHLYYMAGRPYPLVQTLTTTTSIMGNVTVMQRTQWTEGVGTSVPEADAAAPVLYPVPAQGEVNYRLPEQLGPARITIMDATGRVVMERRTDGDRRAGRIDTGSLAPGLYTFTAMDVAGTRSVARFVVD